MKDAKYWLLAWLGVCLLFCGAAGIGWAATAATKPRPPLIRHPIVGYWKVTSADSGSINYLRFTNQGAMSFDYAFRVPIVTGQFTLLDKNVLNCALDNHTQARFRFELAGDHLVLWRTDPYARTTSDSEIRIELERVE